jgi:hypothetical protein
MVALTEAAISRFCGGGARMETPREHVFTCPTVEARLELAAHLVAAGRTVRTFEVIEGRRGQFLLLKLAVSERARPVIEQVFAEGEVTR